MSSIKYLGFFLLSLLISSTTFAAEYTVPRAAYSVYSEDLDLDGDIDIVIGHNYNWQTQWSGVSILENNGIGEFTLIDSIFLYAGQPDIQIKNLNINELPEIIAKYYDSEEENEYIAIINNFNFYDISYFSLNTYEGVENLTAGDIDNDNDIDIIVASNGGQFWGVLYNDGTGQFSEPEYHNVTGYYPTDIACGNLNEDDRNDVAICGQKTEVYFSYETGFDCIILEENDFKEDIEIADMDNDNDNDIIVLVNLGLVGYTGIKIYENTGNNCFSGHELILFQPPLSYFKTSDLNNDNLPDIVCSGTYGVYILYNEGDLQLSEPQYFPTSTSGLSRPPFCADLDGNGYNDIITIRALFFTGILTILFNDGNGNFVEEPQIGVDEEFLLKPGITLTNYPNPFNPVTCINFSLNKEGYTTLKIFNLKGQLVRKLIEEYKRAGDYSILWDSKNKDGKEVSSGLYLYRMQVENHCITRSLTLVK